MSWVMVREIRKYPDPILKKKCPEVKKITPEIKKLAEEMIEILEKSNGVGLAAPQIGELKRVIVVQTERRPEVFINPQIVKKSRETVTTEEGCLSFPGIWLKIKRAKEVEVQALDKEGKEVQIKAEGMPARILQHEIDHLNGIMFVDYLSKLKQKRLLAKIEKIK